jgi:hypothetical protein
MTLPKWFKLFLFIIIVGAGFFFRSFLVHKLNTGLRDSMIAEWAALKGVLQIKNGSPVWNYDREDTDEARLAAKLRRVFLLADPQGSVIQISETYAELGEDAPEKVRTALLAHEPSWRIRKDTKGTAYLIRAGAIYSQDASRTPYFVAIGHPLVDNQRIVDKFTQLYIALVTIIFFGSWLWGRRYLQQPFSVA